VKIESIQQNHWYGKLNEENASAITDEIRRRLDGKKVLIMIDNPSRSDAESDSILLSLKGSNVLPEIVKRALTDTVTDIGQLTDEDRRVLNRYVKRGVLSKGKGGGYPMLKTVYACYGFDFAAQRQLYLDMFMEIANIERNQS
jgi:hypothetical protein